MFKKLLSLSIISIFLGTTAFAAAVIFSGADVKTLKANIDLNGNAKIMSGSVDPTSVATSAPKGSIYLNTSTGFVYIKNDAGSSINWTTIGSTTGGSASDFWSGYQTNTSGHAWVTNSASYVDFTNNSSGVTLTEVNNSNFGTVSPYGGTGASMLPGITFTPPTAGYYFVKATMGITQTSCILGVLMRESDGPSTIDGAGYANGATQTYQTITLGGIYNITSTASRTISLQGTCSGGSGYLTGGAGITSGSGRVIEWTIFRINNTFLGTEAANTIKGNNTSSTSTPLDLSPLQAFNVTSSAGGLNSWATEYAINTLPAGTTATATGITAPTLTATATNADDTTASWIKHTSSTNAVGTGVISAAFNMIKRSWDPQFVSYILTDASAISNSRHWVGMFSASPDASDVFNGHYAAFRYSDTTDGTAFWRACTNNQTGLPNCTTTSSPIAINTAYKMAINCSIANANCLFYINDSLVATQVSQLPTSTTTLGYAIRVIPTTATQRSIRWSRIGIRHK